MKTIQPKITDVEELIRIRDDSLNNGKIITAKLAEQAINKLLNQIKVSYLSEMC